MEDLKHVTVHFAPESRTILFTRNFRAEDELDYHIPKDEDSDDPKAFNEVARCHTGYSYPRAKIAWLNKDGKPVNNCDDETFFDTSGCNADKDDSEVL